MEISKISVFGHQIDVIFTGKHYAFYNRYCGFVALAERVDRPYIPGDRTEEFTVKYGNHHCIGCQLSNDRILSAVKRFIRKEETAHSVTTVNFYEFSEDLANAYFTMDRGLILPR